MSPLPNSHIGSQYVLCNLSLTLPANLTTYSLNSSTLSLNIPVNLPATILEQVPREFGRRDEDVALPKTPWRPGDAYSVAKSEFWSCLPSYSGGYWRDGNQIRWRDPKTGKWYFHTIEGKETISTETFVVVTLIVMLWLYSIYRMWMVWAYTLNFDQSTVTTMKGWDFVMQWLAHRIHTKKRRREGKSRSISDEDKFRDVRLHYYRQTSIPVTVKEKQNMSRLIKSHSLDSPHVGGDGRRCQPIHSCTSGVHHASQHALSHGAPAAAPHHHHPAADPAGPPPTRRQTRPLIRSVTDYVLDSRDEEEGEVGGWSAQDFYRRQNNFHHPLHHPLLHHHHPHHFQQQQQQQQQQQPFSIECGGSQPIWNGGSTAGQIERGLVDSEVTSRGWRGEARGGPEDTVIVI